MTWRIVNKSLLIGRYKPDNVSPSSDKPVMKRRKIAAFDFVRFAQPSSTVRHVRFTEN